MPRASEVESQESFPFFDAEMNATNTWTRCVLLMPEGEGDCAHVRDLLIARDWHVINQSNPYLALAELCIRRRAMVSRTTWGLPGGETQALVIIEPQNRNDTAELLSAMNRYLPSAQVLAFAGGKLLPLAQRENPTTQEIPPADSPPPVVEIPTPRTRPLHLAGTGATDAPLRRESNTPDKTQNEDELAPGITREEIDMLLAMPPADQEAP